MKSNNTALSAKIPSFNGRGEEKKKDIFTFSPSEISKA
jgi:hypothetical protein